MNPQKKKDKIIIDFLDEEYDNYSAIVKNYLYKIATGRLVDKKNLVLMNGETFNEVASTIQEPVKEVIEEPKDDFGDVSDILDGIDF
ncbi:hypothetical protein [Clostridium sp.]|uniref:hypothetical protein n=1 Tax=Clostridium sp. TaxID=1506 RepID=UPI003F8094BE